MNSYFGNRAFKYLEASNRGIWKFVRNKEKRTIAKWIQPESGLSLLDAGAGAGFYSLYFQNEFKMKITAIDSTPAMIDELIKNKIPAFQCSLEEGPAILDNQNFDRILAAGVFEFIAEPLASLKSLSSMLKPGGRIVLLVPGSGAIGMLYDFFHFNIKTYIRSTEYYCKLAERVGLKFIDSEMATPMSAVLCFEKI